MPQIHIGRGTTNLGVFEVAEIKAGLRTGRFLLSDLGWKEGMANWKPLSEFPELTEGPVSDGIPGSAVEEDTSDRPEVDGIPAVSGLPWDRREEIGFVQAYLQTVKLVLTEPGRAFSSMRQEGGLFEPLLFALIGGIIGGVIGQLYFDVTFHNQAFLAQIQQLPPNVKALFANSGGLAAYLLVPIRVALGAFLASGILHLCLMLVGGAKRPFETTFRVICFCMGSTDILLLIPLCGSVLAGVWGLIVQVIGLAKAHDIQTGRALTAVLLPLICCCAFVVAMIFAAAALGMAHGG